MSPLRLLFAAVALFAAGLPLRAGTIPGVSKVYAITLKGTSYSIIPNGTGGVSAKALGTFTQPGRVQVVPQVLTAGTTNGSNFRDVAFLVDGGVTMGGTGALQYVTNGSLNQYVTPPGAYPAADYSYVTKNAAATALTIKHDSTKVNTSNVFVFENGVVHSFATVKSALITVNFLANGRISGKIQMSGVGVLGSGLGSIVANFSGKVVPGGKLND